MHVKLRMNLRRPRRKPKYSLATDSEQVPRGKGEKNRCERSEIVPEMMCLQGVKAGASWCWRAFCLMSLRVTISGKPKALCAGGEAKASPKWAPIVAGSRPEAEVIYP